MLWIMPRRVILGWVDDAMLVGRLLRRDAGAGCGGGLVEGRFRDKRFRRARGTRVDVSGCMGWRFRCLDVKVFRKAMAYNWHELCKDDMAWTGRYTAHRRYAR